MGIIAVFYMAVIVMTLNPRRGIVDDDGRQAGLCHGHFHIACFCQKYLSFIMLAGDSTTILDFHSSCHSQWGRSLGDAFQFAEEVTYVGWLVIAAHLPNHRLTVLVVLPQRGDTPVGGNGRGIDTDLVILGSGDYFLAPVTEDVTLITGRSLRVVVGHRTLQGLYHALAIFINSDSRVLSLTRIVLGFLQQVTIPIDAEVLCDVVLRTTRQRAVDD